MRTWINILLVAVPAHVVLTVLTHTDTFADTPLQHTWVRVAIAFVATLIVTPLLERRGAPKTEG